MEEIVANFVTEYMVLEGVREQFGVTWEEVLEEILLFRGRTQEKMERSIALLEEMWRRRNGPTNAGTCTSVVRAHRGADRKALPPKNIIIIDVKING